MTYRRNSDLKSYLIDSDEAVYGALVEAFAARGGPVGTGIVRNFLPKDLPTFRTGWTVADWYDRLQRSLERLVKAGRATAHRETIILQRHERGQKRVSRTGNLYYSTGKPKGTYYSQPQTKYEPVL